MSDQKNHGTFVTALNCIDGRTQIPVIDYLKGKYGVDYVDMITEAGIDGIMAKYHRASIKNRLSISVEKHNSRAIAVVGHYDCAGNPVSREEHINDIKRAMELVRSWNFKVEVIGLWVNENWEVVEVDKNG